MPKPRSAEKDIECHVARIVDLTEIGEIKQTALCQIPEVVEPIAANLEAKTNAQDQKDINTNPCKTHLEASGPIRIHRHDRS